MDKLSSMRLFVRIIQLGSFARAAESLGMSSATATERVRQLEAGLKAKLLNRTTRRVSLTPEGERYAAVCRNVLDDLEDVEREISEDSRLTRGPVTMSVNVGVFRALLLPKIANFIHDHPEIRLLIVTSDHRATFVDDGVDFAVRVGGLEDQDLIGRPIGQPKRVTVASPDYLCRHGTPRRPEHLKEHRLIEFLLPRAGRTLEWEFANAEEASKVVFDGQIALNDAEARVRLAELGAGIAQTMCFLAAQSLAAGRLVRLLTRWETPAPTISIIYPRTRHLPARVKAAMDFTAETVSAALRDVRRKKFALPR